VSYQTILFHSQPSADGILHRHVTWAD